MEGSVIGSDCNIGEHCFVERGVIIGDRVTIKNSVALWTGVRIEDDVFVGPSVVFTNDVRPRSKVYDTPPVVTSLFRGASIGANASVVAGTTVGSYALIGAGSVVTSDVPPFALSYGNPAKVHGHVCRCTRDLFFSDTRAVCECGIAYEIRKGQVAFA
jgi:acetyltransferase-like isoleucine patch superfamily enzyme